MRQYLAWKIPWKPFHHRLAARPFRNHGRSSVFLRFAVNAKPPRLGDTSSLKFSGSARVVLLTRQQPYPRRLAYLAVHEMVGAKKETKIAASDCRVKPALFYLRGGNQNPRHLAYISYETVKKNKKNSSLRFSGEARIVLFPWR